MNNDELTAQDRKQIQMSRLAAIRAHHEVWRWKNGKTTAEEAIHEVQKHLDFLRAQNQVPLVGPVTEHVLELLKVMLRTSTLSPEDQAAYLEAHPGRLPWRTDEGGVPEVDHAELEKQVARLREAKGAA